MTSNKQKNNFAPGNKPAGDFEAIFQEHWSKIYGVLFSLIGDQLEAEDLALETFWNLYQRPPRDRRVISGWLYRVATNLGFNALRSRNRRQRYEEEAGRLSLQESNTDDPAMDVERRETQERVRQVLAKMKPRSAKLLHLRYSGLSYSELAEALQIAPGSVGKFLSRAEDEFERIYRRLEGG